eukprot:CAMPEP_0173385226 /NCGR_PEP_ID=MMETSP1356-20130122/7835_1 /TAXON_ID=77927 ORGANISM="Hemiselmis virescens, Strain PCC157" /NCGR_SAMPLE_ID=MMETSP1356 /ASSEMBLY_ACC=CAM_ASM_000847 /LENGTH=63 /DNA_ID=CAMNT_0014340935 /DNA_START=166 /DNA_END=354 /DNA_ORIENTATION=-
MLARATLRITRYFSSWLSKSSARTLYPPPKKLANVWSSSVPFSCFDPENAKAAHPAATKSASS